MIKSVNNQDFKIIAVSNRKLCNRPFLEQIERVCKIHPEAVILREKDLCVVYINDEIVLSTRMYNHKGGYAGIYVVQGKVKLIHYKEKRSEQYE